MAAALERLRQAQGGERCPRAIEMHDALRRWQAERLAREYADQARMLGRSAAVAYFLGDVYGDRDFTLRDRQFLRALRPLQRLLPLPALLALRDALELHALTTELDWEMAQCLARSRTALPLDEASYSAAWREVDRWPDRLRQVELVESIGARLGEAVRLPGLEASLRFAAIPAQIAGFGELQAFLERGYDAFAALGLESDEFVATIGRRERAFMRRMAHPAPQEC